MQLALSLIPTGTKNFSLSKLKIYNAVLLVLLSNIVLLSPNDVYGYTVKRYVWSGTNTKYAKDANLGTFYGGTVDLAANDWNGSSSPFDFIADNASTNVIKFQSLSGGYAVTNWSANPSNNNYIQFTILINSNPPDPFYVGTGSVPPNMVDFRYVMRHELGHVLGLGHSVPTASLMYPTAQLGVSRPLDNDAIDGSRYMYDPNYTGLPPERSFYGDTLPPYSGPGTYDDQFSAISYGGRSDSWSSLTGVTNAGFSTISRSGTIGSRAHIALPATTANSITLFFSMGPDRRKAQVFIDNVNVGEVNAQAPYYRRQAARTWPLNTSSPHSFEVRYGPDGGLFDVDMFAVNIATVGAGSYDNNHSQYRNFGTWVYDSAATGAYNNTQTLFTAANSFFRFTFDGTQVTYVYSTANNRGKAAITLDGVDKGIFDMYTASTIRQQSLTWGGLSSGTHTLHVFVTGDKNIQSSNIYVDVDRLIVQ